MISRSKTQIRTDILYLFHGEGHGGDATATLRLASAMKDRGYNTRCAIAGCQRNAAQFADRAARLGVDCDLVDYFDDKHRTSRWQLFLNLRRYIQAQRPTVIHFHTGNAFMHPLHAIGLMLSHRGKNVATLHWVLSPETTEARHIRDQSKSQRFLDGIIVPTQYCREAYLSCLPGKTLETKLHAIGNLADFKAICRADPNKTRQELGLGSERQIILFASLLNDRKRPMDAIDAFKQIALDFPKSILLIAGKGDMEAACQVEAQSHTNQIVFLGYRTDVPNLMAGADINLMPTLGESFGLIALEAMVSGLPNIAYDIPPLREVIGDTGILCPLKDVTALAQGMRDLLNDNTLRHRMGASAKTRGLSQFSEDTIVDAHLEVYGLRNQEQINQNKMKVEVR